MSVDVVLASSMSKQKRRARARGREGEEKRITIKKQPVNYFYSKRRYKRTWLFKHRGEWLC